MTLRSITVDRIQVTGDCRAFLGQKRGSAEPLRIRAREEIVARFHGEPGSRRVFLTMQLLALRDTLRTLGIRGTLLLNGSYISAKPEPQDFDVLLIAPADIQALKELDPRLARLLDAERVEQAEGYTLFYIPSDSPALDLLSTLWDVSKDGGVKGVIRVDV